MEHTYTDSIGRRIRYADGGCYCARPGEPEAFFSILDDRDLEILRLAEREREAEMLAAELVGALGLDREVIDKAGEPVGNAILGAARSLVERERKLREAAITFLGKALTVQRQNTPEWMEYIRDAGNALAASRDIEGRVEIDGDRLTFHARFEAAVDPGDWPPEGWKIHNPDWPAGEGPHLVPED